MIPTTSPAMKIEALRGGLTTLKKGMNARWCESQVLKPTTFGCSSNTAHRPKMMLGIAAARSIMAMSDRRVFSGAYSLRNSAVAMATGAPTIMATNATSTVPTIDARTPNVGWAPRVWNPDLVKNFHPACWNAGYPDHARKIPITTSSRNTPPPEMRTPAR